MQGCVLQGDDIPFTFIVYFTFLFIARTDATPTNHLIIGHYIKTLKYSACFERRDLRVANLFGTECQCYKSVTSSDSSYILYLSQ